MFAQASLAELRLRISGFLTSLKRYGLIKAFLFQKFAGGGRVVRGGVAYFNVNSTPPTWRYAYLFS